VDQNRQAIQEKMKVVQESALMMLGFQLLPFLVASPWAPVAALSDVMLDFAFTTWVMGADYTWREAILSIEFSMVFGTFGLDMKDWSRMVQGSIKRAGVAAWKKAARKSSDVLKEASRNAMFSLSDVVIGQSIRIQDWWRRMRVWSHVTDKGIEDLIRGMKEYLAEAASHGQKFSQDLLDAMAQGKIQIAFRPDIKVGGFHMPGENILVLNPYRVSQFVRRDVKEMAVILLHEFTHYKGYNEWRAHWEQFIMLYHLLLRRKLSDFPTMKIDLAKFATSLEKGGIHAAGDWVQDVVLRRYRRNFADDFDELMAASIRYGGGLKELTQGYTRGVSIRKARFA